MLLDEYQDTSVAQALMLSRLFSGPDDEHGLGHPVTAVGDPNQAIYGWRGASVSNILEFAADFPSSRRPARRRTRSPSTGAPTRASSPPPTTSPPTSTPARPELLPLEPKPGADAGEVRAAVHQTYDDELAWLADQVLATHAAHGRAGAGARSACSPATTPTPPTSSTR